MTGRLRIVCNIVVAALLILLMVQPAWTQDSKSAEKLSRPRLGSPNNVENQLEADRAEKVSKEFQKKNAQSIQ